MLKVNNRNTRTRCAVCSNPTIKIPERRHWHRSEDARRFKYSKKIKIIQQLCQNVAILRPDNGNGVVLLDNQDYVNSAEQLFTGQTKFKILEKDPTVTRMTDRQNYLGNLYNIAAISKAESDQVRPKLQNQ